MIAELIGRLAALLFAPPPPPLPQPLPPSVLSAPAEPAIEPAIEPEPVRPALPAIPRAAPAAATFKVPITDEGLDVAARTVYGESRGEAWLGRVAVAWVLRNRVTADLWNDGKPDWWGEGLIEVCRRPWQFSCWNTDDPNCARLHALDFNDPVLAEMRAIVAGVFRGEVADPTAGSTHYYAPKAVKAPPAWARGRAPTRTIGNHLFYAKVEKGDI